jgi:hypothetical protein
MTNIKTAELPSIETYDYTDLSELEIVVDLIDSASDICSTLEEPGVEQRSAIRDVKQVLDIYGHDNPGSAEAFANRFINDININLIMANDGYFTDNNVFNRVEAVVSRYKELLEKGISDE